MAMITTPLAHASLRDKRIVPQVALAAAGARRRQTRPQRPGTIATSANVKQNAPFLHNFLSSYDRH
jgi:hypothetical protein